MGRAQATPTSQGWPNCLHPRAVCLVCAPLSHPMDMQHASHLHIFCSFLQSYSCTRALNALAHCKLILVTVQAAELTVKLQDPRECTGGLLEGFHGVQQGVQWALSTRSYACAIRLDQWDPMHALRWQANCTPACPKNGTFSTWISLDVWTLSTPTIIGTSQTFADRGEQAMKQAPCMRERT
jgi:hypothetical protein